jgi:hypothetical protein
MRHEMWRRHSFTLFSPSDKYISKYTSRDGANAQARPRPSRKFGKNDGDNLTAPPAFAAERRGAPLDRYGLRGITARRGLPPPPWFPDGFTLLRSG